VQYEAAQWALVLSLDARFGNKDDPVSKTRLSVTGCQCQGNHQISSMLCLTKDLTALLQAAQNSLVPVNRSDIVDAFREELDSLGVGIT
jgi:hypothetical protein